MHRGFIKLYRKTNDWEWKDKPLTVALFVHILTNVNYKPSKWRGQIIEAGQIVTGRIELSKDTGLSIQQIRTSLNHLKSTNNITIKATNKYSIITVTDWGLYQAHEAAPTSKTSSCQPTNNQQITTSKEGKEGKEVKNKEYIYPQDFLDIWAVYPKLRRGNKQKGLTAFKNAIKRDCIENINIGVQNYIDSDEANGQYAKGFTAWFNDDRWKNNYTNQPKGKNDELSKADAADKELTEYLANLRD